MILLVHSCKGRGGILKLWEKCFKRFEWHFPVIYITSGGQYSDQLIDILSYLHFDYVWHMNDDYFIQYPINWDYYYQKAIDLKVDALRMQPNVQFNSLPYRFRFERGLLRQTNDSKYQISLNSSIWRRHFFLDCLSPGLDPWQQENSTKINSWNHKIYFVPRLPFWYVNGTVKGAPTPEGVKVIGKYDNRFKTAGQKV